MLFYSHPQQAQTNLVYGVGYVSQEGSDYQFKQCCYPASPCEEEGRDKGSVLVSVSVSTLRDDNAMNAGQGKLRIEGCSESAELIWRSTALFCDSDVAEAGSGYARSHCG